ncbi:MAG: hypothetical protein H7257_01185 [Taibaiella sp.]|nr:hypothetical protein [Taibaiella sp.]
MKQLTLLIAALMITGASFAQEKSCCKKKGEKCSKEASAACKKKCDKDAQKDAPKKDDNKQAK